MNRVDSLVVFEDFFAKTGGTDIDYLRCHYPRFKYTFEYALPALAPCSTVLDVGAHWLHQAYPFASAGHTLIAFDAPDTLEREICQKQARLMGAKLIATQRMELSLELRELPQDSVDLVLFCEILEHITFNPIPFWKELWRVLRPGGVILLSTPNSVYYRSLHRRLSALALDACSGIAVADIFSSGTYGHHWKEFSIPEVKDYFARLSPEFTIIDLHAVTLGVDAEDEFHQAQRMAAEAPIDNMDFSALLARQEAMGSQPFGSQLFATIRLEEKQKGIVLDPPWIPR